MMVDKVDGVHGGTLGSSYRYGLEYSSSIAILKRSLKCRRPIVLRSNSYVWIEDV